MEEGNKFSGSTAIQIVVDRFYREGDMPKPMTNRFLKQWDDRMPVWEFKEGDNNLNKYFYGGNLKGIETKLDYIADLGFDTICLTPIELSDSYHHYDVGDHMKIDPWMGTWTDLTSLCETAKSKGIKVLADLVFNHTGTNSIYYKDERYKDWYKKDENGNQMFWWGFKDLAEVDTTNIDYQIEMEKVIEKYLKCGICGIRFDLGEGLSKEFYHFIGKAKEKYPDTVYIGEMWDLAINKQDPKIFDGQLDSIMNYPMSDAILRWTAYGNYDHFNNNFYAVYTKYPKNVRDVLLNNIGTHDTPLPTTMLANIMFDENTPIMNPDTNKGLMWDIESPWRTPEGFDTHGFRKFEAEHDRLTDEEMRLAKKLTKLAIAILYFIPGVPCLLQGTEIADAGFKDPFCRKPYNWKNQDKDMQNFVRNIGKIRKDNIDILKDGEVNLATSNEKVLIIERYRFDGHRIVIAANRTNDYQDIGIKNDCDNLKTIYATDDSSKSKLAPYGILVAREN